ncbi:MAG: diguanylate cyclase [Clostridiales bacterium]|nr:diguanylate cyclase [Clostridiales bacterium]
MRYRQSSRLTIAMFIIAGLILGGIYLRFAWVRHKEMAKIEVIKMAKALAAIITVEDIESYAEDGLSVDIQGIPVMGERLSKLVNETDFIRFAYLGERENGETRIFADSGSNNCKDISSLRQIAAEASEINLSPYESDGVVLTDPTREADGIWIRALVPIQVSADTQKAYVLGLCYSVSQWRLDLWRRMVPNFIIFISLFIIFLIIFTIWFRTLRESERSKAVLLSHLPGMAYRTLYDREWTMEFVSEGCIELTGYLPENLLYNRDLTYNDVVMPEYREHLWEEWTRVLTQRENFRGEYEIETKTGERKWVLELGQGVYDESGRVKALEGIILDISEQKRREARIIYLRERDFLTGLYNRSYLEEKKKELEKKGHHPISAIVCDINGLRLINNAYGLMEGDRLIVKVAQLLESSCQEKYIVARTSGGEFIILMPNTDQSKAQEAKDRIEENVDSYNRAQKAPLYDISISMGFSTTTPENNTIDEIIITAVENLQNTKLLNKSSSHYAILSSMMATLYAKSQETDEHGKRLSSLTNMLGEHLELAQRDIDSLKLLSMLHDIGKIGVDDSILNKPGRLTDEEWEQMKLHPEIGYNIAMSTPELEHIAEYILHHHERWDGKGYPEGLKGTDIPLLSRILAVADAFDAMTEDRIYRKGISEREALEEVRRCAGTQFDPEIANLFVDLMSGPNNDEDSI